MFLKYPNNLLPSQKISPNEVFKTKHLIFIFIPSIIFN